MEDNKIIGEDTQVVTPTTATPSIPTTVPYERFKEINDAKKTLKSELDTIKAELETFKTKSTEADTLKAQVEELSKAHTETVTKQQERLMRSIVKAEAIAANLVDTNDVFNFLDFNKLEYDENTDSIKGLSESLATLKESKPYLFKAPVPVVGVNPSGATGGTPSDEATKKKDLFNRMAKGDTKAFDAMTQLSVSKLLRR